MNRLLTLLFSASCLWHSASAASPPNILILYGDDLGSGDLGCYNPESKDRKSTRLNSSHKPISYAVFCFNKTTP